MPASVLVPYTCEVPTAMTGVLTLAACRYLDAHSSSASCSKYPAAVASCPRLFFRFVQNLQDFKFVSGSTSSWAALLFFVGKESYLSIGWTLVGKGSDGSASASADVSAFNRSEKYSTKLCFQIISCIWILKYLDPNISDYNRSESGLRLLRIGFSCTCSGTCSSPVES